MTNHPEVNPNGTGITQSGENHVGAHDGRQAGMPEDTPDTAAAQTGQPSQRDGVAGHMRGGIPVQDNDNPHETSEDEDAASIAVDTEYGTGVAIDGDTEGEVEEARIRTR
jgi:hypothetical protein